MDLYIDTETRGGNLKKGTYQYVEGSELLIVTWAVDAQPVKAWDLTKDSNPPADLIQAIHNCDQIIAHNAQFDRLVLNKHLPQVTIPLTKWRCSMVRAMAHSLPGSLDKLCTLFGLPDDTAKIKDGKRLIRKFCSLDKPHAPDADWARFIVYAIRDVEAMRTIWKLLPGHNYPKVELAHWRMDQVINDRGFAIDVDLVDSVMVAIASAKIDKDEIVATLTTNTVASATKRIQIRNWIKDIYGLGLDNMQETTLTKHLSNPDLDPGLRELIATYIDSNRTSTAKYKAIKGILVDGRARGTLQFDGAIRTGRWAGRTVQPQNFPQGKFKEHEVEEAIRKFKTRTMPSDQVMAAASNCLRGTIIAKPGHKLLVADLSNIEGRMLAWCAKETWKINAFSDLDRGVGHDLYRLAYASSFGIPVDSVTKDQRQIGKVQELALGYGGGVGAFLTFAVKFDLDLDQIALGLKNTLPSVLWDECSAYTASVKTTLGLNPMTYTAIEAVKRLWRLAHPQTTALWKGLENICRQAIETKDQSNPTPFKYGRFIALAVKKWLKIDLPSGRVICFYDPKITDGNITYYGINQYTHKAGAIKTYGGKIVENVVQAMSAHILKDAVLILESKGYPVVLTAHDEPVIEVPDSSDYSVSTVINVLSDPPTWSHGLPLNAKGFETYRYRKD